MSEEANKLKAFISRIETLEEEKKKTSDSIKDVYAEAKYSGFDTKAIRKVIRIRKQDANERKEEEAMLELYLTTLGIDYE